MKIKTNNGAPAVANGRVVKSSSANHHRDYPELQRIDEHVRQTPPEATESLESLARYLGSAAETDLERVRAVYKWITTNITYDKEGLLDLSKRKPTSADLVLQNRITVCEGFSRLMVALCQLVDVECKLIIGYSKGIDYDPLKTIPADANPDHAWNVVKLDGVWRFIEATWGAGGVGEKSTEYENEIYFLTDPEIFIEAHLPCLNSDLEGSKKWQLLTDPIDMRAFQTRNRRSAGCIVHQVELVSHKETLLDVTGEVTLRFRGNGKPLTGFSANFVNKKTCEEIASGRHVAVLLDHRSNEATVTAIPPTTGVFWELNVFGTTMENNGGGDIDLFLIATYYIRASTKSKLPKFPSAAGIYYGLNHNPERCGFTRDLGPFWIKAKGGEHELKLPIASSIPEMADILSSSWDEHTSRFTFVEMCDGFVRVCLRMHQAGYHRLQLFSSDLCIGGNKLLCTASFLIESTKPMTKPRPFPKVLSYALSQRVTLECPRDGELPANSEVQFKLRSPTLTKLMVNKMCHDKIGGQFRFTVDTGAPGKVISVYGSVDPNATSLPCLYMFNVV